MYIVKNLLLGNVELKLGLIKFGMKWSSCCRENNFFEFLNYAYFITNFPAENINTHTIEVQYESMH